MAGAPLTFSDGILALPTSSPMPFDAHHPGTNEDYLDAQFSFPGSSLAHVYPNNSSSSYGLPMSGLGLTVDYPVEERGVNPEDLRLASPAVEHAADPATTPLPMEILDHRAQVWSQPNFAPSFMNLADDGNGAVDAQPTCIDPAVLAAFWAPPPDVDTHADAIVDDADDQEDADEQEFGSDTEREQSLMPSSTSTLPVPLPDVVDDKRSTKRAASGEPKRASKRRRGSSAGDDKDFHPAPRRAARPRREQKLQINPGETEAEVRARTCARCWRKFGREAELVRHLKESACGTADKRSCPICKSRLGLRGDAFARHLRDTRKCLTIQAAMTREQLEALGCLPPAAEDGEPKAEKNKKGKGKKAL